MKDRPVITPYRFTGVVCWDCRPDLWNGSWVFSPVTPTYCSQCKKYMDPLDQPRKSIDDFDWDKYYREQAEKLGTSPETYKWMSEKINNIPPPIVEDRFRDLLQKELDKKDQEIENLWGLVRRLEKSNQKLGDELHRLTAGEGWNKNVK